MQVRLLRLGATTQSWTCDGVPLILGHEVPRAYRGEPFYAGAIVGRVAGRVRSPVSIDGANCILDANEGDVHLHGGAGGLTRHVWAAERDGSSRVRFHLHSKHGAGGYPGAVDFEVIVTLLPDGLVYEMQALPDRATWISMAQHNYYCLGGAGIRDLTLDLPAAQMLVLDAQAIATGDLCPVPETLDLRGGRALSGRSLDHAFVLQEPEIVLQGPGGELVMKTDQPCVQVYTGMGLSAPFHPGGGVAIEPQGYPNAPHCPAFPLRLAAPDAPYSQRLHLRFCRDARPRADQTAPHPPTLAP